MGVAPPLDPHAPRPTSSRPLEPPSTPSRSARAGRGPAAPEHVEPGEAPIASPTPDLTSVVRRIGSLFERAYAPDACRPSWPEIEELLTEGYARALALEGERSDIEGRIATLVTDCSEQDPTPALRTLSARHAEVDRNVRWLRSLLEELRQFGSDMRGGGSGDGPERPDARRRAVEPPGPDPERS